MKVITNAVLLVLGTVTLITFLAWDTVRPKEPAR